MLLLVGIMATIVYGGLFLIVGVSVYLFTGNFSQSCAYGGIAVGLLGLFHGLTMLCAKLQKKRRASLR